MNNSKKLILIIILIIILGTIFFSFTSQPAQSVTLNQEKPVQQQQEKNLETYEEDFTTIEEALNFID